MKHAAPEERLIAFIRDRAIETLERERGELQPIALWIDEDGRIGGVSVYAGHDFPEPDHMLVEVRTALRLQAQRDPRVIGVATAHRERVRMPGADDSFESVCVQYESRTAPAVRVYFPYRIKKKLSATSDVTILDPVRVAGTAAVFP